MTRHTGWLHERFNGLEPRYKVIQECILYRKLYTESKLFDSDIALGPGGLLSVVRSSLPISQEVSAGEKVALRSIYINQNRVYKSEN